MKLIINIFKYKIKVFKAMRGDVLILSIINSRTIVSFLIYQYYFIFEFYYNYTNIDSGFKENCELNRI